MRGSNWERKVEEIKDKRIMLHLVAEEEATKEEESVVVAANPDK